METHGIYLYHMVPDNLRGDTLYPLNLLQKTYPAEYEAAKRRYVGREHLLTQRIAALDCFWGDVLFLTPCHPARIAKAFQEIGLELDAAFYEIDATKLAPDKAAIWLGVGDPNDLATYVAYKPETLKQYDLVTRQTSVRYRQAKEAGHKPYLFEDAPHVLYRGPIEVPSRTIVLS